MPDPTVSTFPSFDKMWLVWVLKQLPIPKDIQRHIWFTYLVNKYSLFSNNAQLLRMNLWNSFSGHFEAERNCGWISSADF